MKKRLLSGILVFCLLATLFTMGAEASSYGMCGNALTWTLDDAGTLTISGSGPMWDFTRTEDEPWFQSLKEVRRVIVGEGITGIGAYAFFSCVNLTSVALSASVSSIGYYAFGYCSSLSSVSYNGTNAQWSGIQISEGNTSLASASIAFSGTSGKTEFTDVPDGAYYEEAIVWAVANDVSYGITDTTFGPNSIITRAQAVTFLWRALGRPNASASNNRFTDVKSTDYYAESIAWAVQQGITDGATDTTFEPDEPVSREQMLTFLSRAAGVATSGGNVYQQAVSWAQGAGLLNGIPGTFVSNDPCPRSDVIYYLWAWVQQGGDTVVATQPSASATATQMPAYVTNSAVLHSGTFDEIEYIFYEDGTLIIEGNGKCGDWYSYTGADSTSRDYPWHSKDGGWGGSITKVIVDDGVTFLGSFAFAYLNNVTSIILPNSIMAYGVSVFESCTSLTHIKLPNGAAVINFCTFWGCSNLESIDVPSSIDEIKSNAFDGTINLTTIYYEGSKTQWESIKIGSDNDVLSSATIHYNVR